MFFQACKGLVVTSASSNHDDSFFHHSFISRPTEVVDYVLIALVDNDLVKMRSNLVGCQGDGLDWPWATNQCNPLFNSGLFKWLVSQDPL